MHPADNHIRQGMIETKVGMGHEVQRYWYIIQPMSRESIRSTEYTIEIMSPEIISYKAQNSYPDIRLNPIFLMQGPFGISPTLVENRQQYARECSY
jgi:hypothetical protein